MNDEFQVFYCALIQHLSNKIFFRLKYFTRYASYEELKKKLTQENQKRQFNLRHSKNKKIFQNFDIQIKCLKMNKFQATKSEYLYVYQIAKYS